ncbi:MAG TPA: hypothetical protein VL400_23955, partial [Polyangiaceae bacterium]|nr:hypothetical protein [Polyangiaceae bacterium]
MRLRHLPWLLGAAIALAGVAGVGPSTSVAWAADPAKLKAAAESFEAGARAYKDKKYEEAAAHFEAADDAVPSAKALRLAIRARDEAK